MASDSFKVAFVASFTLEFIIMTTSRKHVGQVEEWLDGLG